MVKVLEKAGCSISYPPNQTCCGQPAYNAGFARECLPVAAKFLNDFSAEEMIVSPSGSCAGFVANYYKDLFTGTNTDLSASHRIYEFTDFLCNVLDVDDFGASFPKKVTYHNSCAALRECKIKAEPRRLLERVQGLELIEMADNETCCGFGGTFAVKFQDISYAMAEQKIDNAIATGAEYIVSTDLSCLMHIDGVIKNKSLNLKTIHIADVLASGW